MRPAAVYHVKLEAETKKASGQLTLFEKQLYGVEKQGESTRATVTKFGKDVDRNRRPVDSLSGSLANLALAFTAVRNTARLIKIPALLSAVQPAVEGVNALAAGATAVTGALIPAAGAATAAASAYGAMGQAAGVLALAGVKDLGTVVGGLNEKMDKQADAYKNLTPQAQKFAQTLDDTKKPLLDIQKAVQKPLFEGMNAGLQAARANLPVVEKVLTGTARAMGRLAEKGGEFVGRKGFGRDLEKIGKTNTKTLSRMGNAGLDFADALRHVLVEARPLVGWMTKMGTRFSEYVKDSARAGRESGDLAKFFDQTKKLLKVLVPAIGNFGKGLWNVARAGQGLGMSIFKKLGEAAEDFRKWTESAKGKNAIAEWFKDAKPPLWEAGRLIRDVGEAFFDLGKGGSGGLTNLIRTIRKDLLPTFVSLAKASRGFGPLFLDLVKSLMPLLQVMMGPSGVLTLLVQGLTGAARAITFIVDKVPGLKLLIGTFLGTTAAVKIAVAGFRGVATAVTAVTVAMRIMTGQQAVMAASMTWGPMAQAIAKVGTSMGFLKATATGLTLTMRGLMLATGIGALIVAATLIVTHWKEVKKFMQPFVDWLVKTFGPVWEDVSKWVVQAMQDIWKAIGPTMADIGNAVKDAVEFAVPILKKLGEIWIQFILPIYKKAFEIWKATIGKIFEVAKFIVPKVIAVWKFFFERWKDIWKAIIAVVKVLWGGITKFIINPLKKAWEWIKEGPIGDIARWLADKFRAAIDGVKNVIGGLGGFFRGVFDGVKNAIIDALNFVIGKLNWMIRAYNNTAAKLPGVGEIGEIGTIEKSRGGIGGSGVESRDRAAPHGRAGRRAAARAGGIEQRYGGQTGGLVTSHGIAGFQRGGMVGPGPRDTVKAALEPGEMVIPRKAVKEAKERAKFAGKALKGELGKGQKDALKGTKEFTKGHDKEMKGLQKGTEKQTEKTKDKTSDDFKKLKDNAKRHAKDMQTGVVDSFRSMTSASTSAMADLEEQVNKALKALGVKGISFGVSAGSSEGGGKGKKMQRGGKVGGSGVGDKMPTWLEPGEYVLNKKLTRAIGRPMLDMWNSDMVPRMASGGLVQALGPYTVPPIQYDPNHAGGNSHLHIAMSSVAAARAMARRISPMGWTASEAPWTPGGVAPIHQDPGHYTGSSFDANSADEGRAAVAAVARVLGGGAVSGVGGAAIAKLKRPTLDGPKGPLKSMGQAAIDKVHKAANAYLAKKAPREGSEGAFMTGDGNVERMFAKVAKRLSSSKTATEALGMAGYAESGMRDLGYGDSTSLGALQLLSSTASGMGIDPHDEAAVASAFLLQGFYGRGGANRLAAQGLPSHLVAQGVQGSAFASGSNYLAQKGAARGWMGRYNLQKGGMPKLAEGGRVRQAGLAHVDRGDVHRGTKIELVVKGDAAAFALERADEVYAIVDGERVEVQGHEKRHRRRKR